MYKKQATKALNIDEKNTLSLFKDSKDSRESQASSKEDKAEKSAKEQHYSSELSDDTGYSSDSSNISSGYNNNHNNNSRRRTTRNSSNSYGGQGPRDSGARGRPRDKDRLEGEASNESNEFNEEEATLNNEEAKVLDLVSLRNETPQQLLKLAEEAGIQNLNGASKQELIMFIARKKANDFNMRLTSSGVIEVLNEGFGFIRSARYNYLASQDDVYVSPGQIKRLNIRTGDVIHGEIRPPRKEERYFALIRALEVNSKPINHIRKYINFESLVPFYPDTSLTLECEIPKRMPDGKKDLSGRIIDIVAPLGKGQRALIVAPPKTGKTMLLQGIAHSIATNYPEVHLIVLLIDERPEEVTDMQRSIKGEVISSTFDEPADKHVYVAEFVIEKAKRLVEQGRHVVILLDSITRLARAYNTVIPSSGKLLSGGVDSNALQKAKRLFGAARNIEGAGSLTIIGSTLVDTGSRMDEIIYEEFKGTGNCEIVLDRKLSDKRLFPAIDITKSGTRKEELLLNRQILNKIWVLRRILNQMGDADAMEFMRDKLERTTNNEEFFLFMERKSN